LRDGTVVILNAGTNLSISKDFGRQNRDVRLRYGQAYFQVARSSGTPFVVDVAGNRTTVLGTTFGVRAYSPDTVQVAVREGKVVFNGAVLTNNDIATATLTHGVHVAHAQKVDGVFGFVTGRLVLDEVTLAAAVPELERWYDVKIRFSDPSIGSRHITAVLLSGSPRDLVDILQAIFGISVVRDGRTLTLHTMEHGR
jgi:ferric-dicitrate binding protein FerR (iron transport regulator)